jgi:hypothetical protein
MYTGENGPKLYRYFLRWIANTLCVEKGIYDLRGCEDSRKKQGPTTVQQTITDGDINS